MADNTFTYGGISSSEFFITYDTEHHYILPQKRKYTQDIIGFDGVADFDIKGYDVGVMTVKLYFEGDYSFLRENSDRIAAWLYNDGTAKQLIFDNKPDRYYMAKIYAGLDFENTQNRNIGELQFEFNPPWAFLFDGTLIAPELINWINCEASNNQFYKEFSENGYMRLINKGRAVKPIIKIFGNIKKGLTVTYDNTNIIINADVVNDGIAIDCINQTVTRLSDGENMYPFLTSDNFFEFASGNIQLDVSMPDINKYPESIVVFVEMNVTALGG